jgi:hypothetical protein
MRSVDPINRLFTQEVQGEYITRSSSLPVNSRYIESPSDLLWRLPLVMEIFRALDLPRSIQKHLPILERQGKFREADYIESFISKMKEGSEGGVRSCILMFLDPLSSQSIYLQ